MTALESKVDNINDACTKISTQMDEVPSKSYVLWFGVGVVALAILTLLGHLLIRYLGAPPGG